MITDLISGQVHMLVINLTGQVRDLHQAGKLRMLAVTTPARIKIAPDVPAAVEAGLSSMTFENFTGLFAPAGTPNSIIERIAQATRVAMADDEFRHKLIASGFEPYLDCGPDAAHRFIKKQVSKWTPVIKSMGLKMQ